MFVCQEEEELEDLEEEDLIPLTEEMQREVI